MAEQIRIKICFVSPNVYPLYNPLIRSSYGGAETQLYELACFFGRDENMEVSVVTGNYGQQEVEYYSGVLVYRTEFDTKRSFFGRIIHGTSPLQKLLKKIDAQIYFMAGASGITQDVAKFCTKNRRAFIYRVTHQRDCDGSFVHGSGPEGEKFRWAIHHAYRVICQTEKQKNLLRRTEDIKAEIIPNVIYLPAPTYVPRHDILWVGQAVEWKQPELFLRLAMTLQNYNFTMIVMPRDQNYLERLVEKTRDVNNLGFENRVPYQDMATRFERAKLLVNTSRFEGFPYSFTQAMAAGVPIVSLNVDPDGIFEKEQVGVCAQGSEVRLAQAVGDLMTYERQWNSYSKNAQRYIETQQSFRELEQVYRRLFIKCYRTRKK